MSNMVIGYLLLVDRSKAKILRFGLVALLLITYYLLLITYSPVYAQDDTLVAPGGSLAAETKIETIPQYIVNTMFLIAAFLAVAYLMYGGIKWITSRGDKIQVEAARKHIVAAIIGLVVVAGSFFVLNVVFTMLGSDNPLKDGFKFKSIEETNDAAP